MMKTSEGKKVLILTGVHGNEYSAVKVGLQLKKYFGLTKDVYVEPFANQLGLLHGTRDIPSTQTNDLNRMFIDKNVTFETIKKLIDEHDIIIDIHNSPDCAPFVLLNNDKFLNNLSKWVNKSGVEYVSRNSTANTIKKYCLKTEKVGITYEFGDMTHCTREQEEKVFKDIVSLVKNKKYLEFMNIDRKLPQQELLSFISHDYGYVERLCKEGEELSSGDELFAVVNETERATYKAGTRMKVIIWNNNFVEDGSEVFQYIEK